MRRPAIWWGLGVVVLTVLTAVFWPSLEGSDALSSFNDMESLLEAFGAQNIATPAGYLDGQLYALMLPLLLSGFAIAGVSGLTSGDEDAGRLELIHALPVSRSAVWLGRWGAAMLVLSAVALVTTVVMLACLPLFSLEEIGIGQIVGATVGCAVLAAFHASVAYAVGGLGAARTTAVGAAVLVLVAGYVLAFLVPLVDALAGARSSSPWHWAIAEQPVSNGVDARWLLVLIAVIAALVGAGTMAVERRDLRSP